jgi:hypothetical protein
MDEGMVNADCRNISVTCLAAFIVGTWSACAPIQGYQGPELPPEQVALVEPRYNSPDSLLREAAVDSIKFASKGISVLPGKHLLNLSDDQRGDKLDCERFATLDHDGYEVCLADKKHGQNCSCWDYLSIQERCFYRTRSTNCRGPFSVNAGQTYEIVPTGTFKAPSIELRQRGVPASLARFSCIGSAIREEPFLAKIGSGRFTAKQYGLITPCH